MHRYQPQLESSFQGVPYARPDPIPAYAPPDIFMPMHRQGGFWYPPGAREHDLGGTGPDNPVSFGSYPGTQGAGASGSGGQTGEDIGLDDLFAHPPPPEGGGRMVGSSGCSVMLIDEPQYVGGCLLLVLILRHFYCFYVLLCTILFALVVFRLCWR